MGKRVLVLEPSLTTQALLKEKTKNSGLELSFDTNGIRMLVTLYNSLPDALLINARNMNPKCVALSRLVKSVARFSQVPVGVFATSDFLFDEEFMKDCGADAFIKFDPKSLVFDIKALCDKKGGALAVPEENDIVKSGILNKIFSTIESLSSIEQIAASFLNLICEVAEIPASALFINLSGGTEGFYLLGENFTEEEGSDFLKVCKSDFLDRFPGLDLEKFIPQKINGKRPCRFHSDGVPLSAYQTFELKGLRNEVFATLHVLKEGSFSARQMDLLSYSARQISLILQAAAAVRQNLKFERNIRKAFGRFVPEQIIDQLVDDAEKQNEAGVGEKRDVAILFSDIRSFTNISEKNKPEVIVAFLNRYFTIMCTIIKKHGGTIDKFIGDAIMALFGAPVSYEDNCRRAVAAANEMREALSLVPLGDLQMPEGMKFNIGIGIHYGDVIVGSIGSSDKTDYSVIGDSVNLASRLEGLTKTYGAMVLVSESVKKDVADNPDGFVFRRLDDVKVKGKTTPVPIYAVDKNIEEFSAIYRDSYAKGFDLYKRGVWKLAEECFEKALEEAPNDKAASLMKGRCQEFELNPPQNWDGAIAFTTK